MIMLLERWHASVDLAQHWYRRKPCTLARPCVLLLPPLVGEMVALVGAHTLGRCHTDRSGYSGPWTNAPTTFSNLYFQELLNNKW